MHTFRMYRCDYTTRYQPLAGPSPRQERSEAQQHRGRPHLEGKTGVTSSAATEQARTTAHRQSVTVSQQDLIEALTTKLGAKLVAFIVDRDVSTISRWKSGGEVGEAALLPLRIAYQVVQMLEGPEADSTIRAWFMGSNPQLDDLSPAEALHDGLNRETLAAARAFLAGG